MEARVWYTSKAVWFNVLTFIVASLALTEFQTVVPKEWLGILTAIGALINLAIRIFFTNGPVTVNQQSAAAYNRNYGGT